MERNKFFETANLKKLFFKAAIPGALGMLFSALYQLIDGIFVNFYVGETAFAAVNFSFPIVFMLFGISDLIGVGSSVIIAIKHGEGNRKEADGEHCFRNHFLFQCETLISRFRSGRATLRIFGSIFKDICDNLTFDGSGVCFG